MTLSYLLFEFRNNGNCQGQLFMFFLSVVVVPKVIFTVSHLRTEGKHGVFLRSSTNLHTLSEHTVYTVTSLGIPVDKKPSINKS